MGWFTRVKEGITTSTEDKKETPEGLWYKCPECSEIATTEDHENNLWVCAKCGHHEKIGSAEYFALLFDDQKYKEIGADLAAGDPLHFEDTKKYVDRLAKTRKDTGLNDALRAAEGKLDKYPVVIACMDFRFIGGSMGSVVGEKIALAADTALRKKCPFIIISKSGGARMMEAGFSLMQMAKTSAKLTLLAKKRIPYISVITDPTTGGV
ncbi:MAG TPA: acetyl-CoA carboxylase carboxyltransferase subunit beta, partial [Flavobacteriales bacterium]|nr:acetyl-CoA carboxylase carboxyltransferase subunit beta [Flavobacteriales bacterium]